MDNPLPGSDGEEEKRIPHLSRQEQFIVGNDIDEDAIAEARLFSKGASRKDFEEDAKNNDAIRAEKFRDHFENVSIVAIWFGALIFACFTLTWAANLVLPKRDQFLDDNQEDKLQLIITGGFVAGIASSHIKKRLGG